MYVCFCEHLCISPSSPEQCEGEAGTGLALLWCLCWPGKWSWETSPELSEAMGCISQLPESYWGGLGRSPSKTSSTLCSAP